MRTVLALTVTITLCLSSFKWHNNPDPVGTWEYYAHTEEGHKGTFTIQEAGDHLNGILISKDQEITLNKVNLDGNILSFELVAEGYFCQVKGKIAGDDYEATLTVDGTDMPLEATRVE